QFNDPGMNSLYKEVMDVMVEKTGVNLKSSFTISAEMSEKIYIIPPARTRYLSEISENNRNYDKWSNEQADIADKLYGLHQSIEVIRESKADDKDRLIKPLQEEYARVELDFDPRNKKTIEEWEAKKKL